MIRILVVEDNDLNRNMLASRLRRNGYETEIAVNGKDALLIDEPFKLDLILIDMNLPVMDGWEATRALKKNAGTRRIPIIGLSAHARDMDIIKSMEAGCDAYETKPVDIPQLLAVIHTLTDSK